MQSNKDRHLSQIESYIGYRFANRRLLTEALTHSSYAFASRMPGVRDNQRLEFFGDAVLGLIVSNRLLALYPESGEGRLSRMRATLVDTGTLAALAERIRLGGFILLSRGEEKNGGRTKKSILAGAFEALTAAVYLDGGIDRAERFVDRLFGPLFEGEGMSGDVRDYKTKLQELAHSLSCTPPFYILEDVTGPDHDLHFTVTVMVGDECFGRGTGKTRKEAEQLAAREGLLLLEEDVARSGRK
jgi:ribonuclease-3